MKTFITITLLIVATTSFSKKGSATDQTDAEKKGIQLMREEEKLAHDVYLFLYEKWEIPIFSNISNAEIRHFDTMGFLIEKFELKDPAKKEIGKFQSQDLQNLYDSLILQGDKSLIEAFSVGAFIEEVDIHDLQQLIAITSNETVLNIYNNLLQASGNHIRAFTGQLESRDIIYSPRVLEKEVYQKILDTSHRRGGGTNYVLPQNNCPIRQNTIPLRNRNRGKGQMRNQGVWN